MRERDRQPWRRELAWSVGGAAITAGLLALVGPFGTYGALDLPDRAVYWFVTVGIIWLQTDLVLRLLYARLEGRITHARWIVPVVGALLVSVPATAVVIVVTDVMIPAADIGVVSLYWKVTLLLLVIALVFGSPGLALAEPAPARLHADVPPADTAQGPESLRPELPEPPKIETGTVPPPTSDAAVRSFRRRLSEDPGGDLLCLEMEDHYLRVHTTEGTALVLCRMADAEHDLRHADGMRVHRSYWVMRSAVAGYRSEGRRTELELIDGLRVPVGKTYRSAVRERGLLRDAARR